LGGFERKGFGQFGKIGIWFVVLWGFCGLKILKDFEFLGFIEV
jgi:hypothetical protein